jgi:hypothetical protein
VLLFTCWWEWANDAGGSLRWLKWLDNSGNGVVDLATEVSGWGFNGITHIRRIASADTWYSMQVQHDKGTDLNGNGLFAVTRIR